MGRMIFGTHDFERRIYDINSFEDYDRVIKLLKDPNLRRLLQIIAHKPITVIAIVRTMRRSAIVVKMMLKEIDKLGFLITKETTSKRDVKQIFYHAKYNTFIFDMR